MRLRRLKLRVLTDKGLHGATLDFVDGLNVLWADNTMGKSTCIKSILIALGMEDMLTTSHTLPLAPVLNAKLETEEGLAAVLESDVFLEIENTRRARITVHRTIKGTRDTHLITVTHGPALTAPNISYLIEDYFVCRPGGATRERGFHQFLADFIGWELPQVPTYDGREHPLYLQCIFPYFVVEQTRGWSSIQPPLPTHFRIREPHKRTVEFIMGMDAYEIASKRQALQGRRIHMTSEWSALVREAQECAERIQGVAQAVPASPTAAWPPVPQPGLLVAREDAWVGLGESLRAAQAELGRLTEQEIPRIQEVADSLSVELAETERRAQAKEATLARIMQTLELEAAEQSAIQERLAALDEDLQKNKDIRILRDLGSTTLRNVSRDSCPTCHQAISGSLLPGVGHRETMSIDENINFVTEQQRTFRAALAHTEKLIESRQQQAARARFELNQLRARIRSLRQTLVADGRLPSMAAIRERIRLEDRIQQEQSTVEAFDTLMSRLESLAAEWDRMQRELAALPSEDISAQDRTKIDDWSRNFVDQLKQYGFRSFPVESISISPDSYRPEHEGFDLPSSTVEYPSLKPGGDRCDLPSSISASDLIRAIWAYLTGLLEISRSVKTNHPGLLVLDEPKQQSTKDLSFRELLRRMSTAGSAGQQVLLATSEDRDNLRGILKGMPHNYIEIEGRIIRRTEN